MVLVTGIGCSVTEPFFQTIHGEFELVEGIGVGDADVALAVGCEGSAWDNSDAGFGEQCMGKLVGCHVGYFNGRKHIKCAVRLDGREPHIGEPGVEIIAPTDVLGIHCRWRIGAFGQCADSGVLGWDAGANGVVGMDFGSVFCPLGRGKQEADAPARHGMGFG